MPATLPLHVRWEPGRSHAGTARVDVLSAGQVVAEDVEFIDGSVTETLALGVRAKLSLQVEPSRLWLEWFNLPLLELRVWSGLSWGRTEQLLPLGVFPVDPPARSLPLSAVSISADDRWAYIARNDLLYDWPGPSGWNSALAARLMVEGGLDEPTVTVDRDLISPGVMWEGKRHDLIRDYLLPIGADAYVDRTGLPRIETRRYTDGAALTDGEDGTVVKVSSTVDLSGVFNAVGAASSKSGVVIEPPAFVAVTDVNHPAHPSKIGQRQTRVTSQAIDNYGDAINFARSELERLSSPALGWTVECVPDATRMPGDRVTVTTGLGSVQAIIRDVTHPLGGGATQRIALGATL